MQNSIKLANIPFQPHAKQDFAAVTWVTFLLWRSSFLCSTYLNSILIPYIFFLLFSKKVPTKWGSMRKRNWKAKCWRSWKIVHPSLSSLKTMTSIPATFLKVIGFSMSSPTIVEGNISWNPENTSDLATGDPSMLE